jgi:HSP20 family molecular chaperone IbpA
VSQRFDEWSNRMFDEMQGMEQRIDRIFHDAAHDLNANADWLDNGSFSASVKLSDQKDAYVVRLALPERDLSKLSATVDANNTLRIVAQEEKKEKATSANKAGNKGADNSTYIMGRYEQLLSLPGPVDASKIKIDHSGNGVTVTVPKAEPAAHALPSS